MLDARGQFARAARSIREANALTLDARRGQNEFVPADHERFINNVINRFDAGFFGARADWARTHAGRSSSSACRDREHH